MFYYDCDDLNEEYDETRKEVIRLIKSAQDSLYFYDTKLMKSCVCLNWEAYQTRINDKVKAIRASETYKKSKPQVRADNFDTQLEPILALI
jgi:hypothetical protein